MNSFQSDKQKEKKKEERMRKILKQTMAAMLAAAFTIAGSAQRMQADEFEPVQEPVDPVTLESQADEPPVPVGPPIFAEYVTEKINARFADEAGRPENEASHPVDTRKRISMYRVYNPNSGEHFYTASEVERDFLVKAGWHNEGIGWYAPEDGDPVFRMYNPNSGDHHYTLEVEERDDLVKFGWNYEGIGWRSDSEQSVPLYRLYNPNEETGNHHYTTDQNERETLIRAGWINEEIGWYGLPALSSDPYEKDGFYYSGDGQKLTGLQKVNGRFYYFDPEKDGKKAIFTGLKKTDKGDVIFGNGDGTLYAGPKEIEGRLYWFLSDQGRAARNEFRLLPASYLGGQVDFAWFNDESVMETGHQANARQQYAYVVLGAGNLTYFADNETGASRQVAEYLMDRFSQPKLNALMSEALKYEGSPYVWAGKSPATGFDCSGLVTWCMKQKWNVDVDPIMTNAAKIYTDYCQPVLPGAEQTGDLIFWRGTYGSNPNYISHVGIYIGNDWMYCAGDPIGFYPAQSVLRPDGTIAPWLFGRVK